MSAIQPSPTNLAEGYAEAVRRARVRLAQVDLRTAAARGGLSLDSQGRVKISLFGQPFWVAPASLAISTVAGRPVKIADELLILRYLESDQEIAPLGELIAYRALPGGMFYWGPVEQRTTRVILGQFGNDIDRLRAALGRYPHEMLDLGDLSARIQAMGRIDITLVYRRGDDEFPPTLDLLYDRSIAAVYHTDEVAALATRLAFGLVRF